MKLNHTSRGESIKACLLVGAVERTEVVKAAAEVVSTPSSGWKACRRVTREGCTVTRLVLAREETRIYLRKLRLRVQVAVLLPHVAGGRARVSGWTHGYWCRCWVVVVFFGRLW